MAEQGVKDAAQQIGVFYDELLEGGFTGSLAEAITAQSAPIITSYVLYGHITTGN